MPRGRAIVGLHQELFDATSRILDRSGPAGVSTRAITEEAACSKGILHNHFAGLDDFLVQYIRAAFHSSHRETAKLTGRVGTGTVRGNLGHLLARWHSMPLRHAHDLLAAYPALRSEVGADHSRGEHGLRAADDAIVEYLSAEQRLGRIDQGIDVQAATFAITSTAYCATQTAVAPQTGRELTLRVVDLVLGARAERSVGQEAMR